MATFQEMAPIISGLGITQSAVINYFENIPAPPESPVPPEITIPKVVAVADIVFSGIPTGLTKIAREASLNKSQVKELIAELSTLKAKWDALQVEEEL